MGGYGVDYSVCWWFLTQKLFNIVIAIFLYRIKIKKKILSILEEYL